MHECPRCNYNFNQKCHLRNHFNRKTLCKFTKDDISREECLEMLKQGNLKILVNKKGCTPEHKCEYCNQQFDRKQRLVNHNLICKLKKENNITIMIEIMKKNHEKLEKLENKLEEKLKNKELKPKPNFEFVYIVQTREFINSGEEIYKLGKTTNIKQRLGGYPKGSILLDLTKCENCHTAEKDLLKIFESKFTKMKNLGNEYFQGDIDEMTKEIGLYFNCK